MTITRFILHFIMVVGCHNKIKSHIWYNFDTKIKSIIFIVYLLNNDFYTYSKMFEMFESMFDAIIKVFHFLVHFHLKLLIR